MVNRRCVVCNGFPGEHALGCPTRVAESVRRESPGAGSLETVECPVCAARVPHVYVGEVGQVGRHPVPGGEFVCEGSFEETVMRGHLDLPKED